MDLQSIVQAVRGQHHGDFRPNKAMCPARLNQLLSGYKHKELLVQVAQSDIPATWKKSPRYGNIAVDSAMIHDLQWTQMILDNGRLQELPLAMYTEMQPIDVHLYMDASNQGLAVLNPAVRQYIQVQFDEEEKDMIRKATGPNGFNINVPVKPMLRKIYTTFSINFNPTHWPQCQEQSTSLHGIDGRRGARRADIIDDYLQTAAATRTSSLSLLSTIGAPQQAQEGAHWRSKLCCPRLVTSLGIICATSDTRLGSMMGISWPCAGCSGCLHLHDKKNLSPLQCYEDSENYVTAAQPTAACSGAAVVGFFFLFRRSEYLADGKKVKPCVISTNDVHFITERGLPTDSITEVAAITIVFRGSKTDQAGVGTKRTLHRSGSPWLCPVLASWELMRISRSYGTNEALCATGTGKVLAANRLSEVIKNAAVALGSEPSRFGTHSMRSGGATAMFVAGVDRLMIKSGRWTSDAYERYTRMNDMVSRSLAQQMSRGARSRVSPV
ncbi:hypothetical protein PC110_g14296 [Phytophthora cactorum]|uniref:Tyr recombinase domain-containing protein n=1 Tax=Phytophthora cactorum TaxID=29920 RepID=A0A329RY02_9STRA|nr:hypothetical protein PC114_g1102 [Phytophthora cactorum]RAW29355.1 hypothetical protein PC110_g14296 [Phytophthora cactorum]